MICDTCLKRDKCERYSSVSSIKDLVSSKVDMSDEDLADVSKYIESKAIKVCDGYKCDSNVMVVDANNLIGGMLDKLDCGVFYSDESIGKLRKILIDNDLQELGYRVNMDMVKGFNTALFIIKKLLQSKNLVVLRDCEILEKIGIPNVSDLDNTQKVLEEVLDKRIGKPLVVEGYCGFTDYECASCGADIPKGKGFKFCYHCGQKIGNR